ncbi:hypothetical protein ACQ1Q1_04970 [Ornithobacterium rhinotracheale]|uniref:Uncharacterized protein n=1 Tax=Ornithobacterium rhinotracheale (strain ATCC 51463 / DSM 15997 / CCUG 23171 / CIP 104009 / LMG 9086) TaxID=867902 RepID=I3ZZF5_ORNRL|nr:hypothetical protein [Ornithobacterium rhinotracheale]AFL97089.1 hypothetical protein Ornrh_0894 [Ornithobacterium rhinotracheale DSM 15997]AIQ00453.1 hypothetical protein Q785_05040 [Ornithobacterium rhinotracheale ORT-UMN 88]KGB67415.1 hypothetical protein Q787_04915 [Ornithobacterium rhinotracheale H06-030791]MCK0194392.1 hypothetical protein [Ornithobacterium rhinotracheale]UOH64493.1 hypothetical protein MT993_04575 [Ornithobacterium rhinotracheale]
MFYFFYIMGDFVTPHYYFTKSQRTSHLYNGTALGLLAYFIKKSLTVA